MTDDRLQRWLEAAGEPLTPDSSFADALRRDLRVELGFERAPRGWSSPARRTRLRSRPASRARTVLLIAAAVALAALGVVGIAGTLQDESAPTDSPGLLAAARARGELRIAVRPDHPQAPIGGATAVGFDVDVANELARRLGLRPALVIVPIDEMLETDGAAHWDLALPSVATWQIGPSFAASTPYYYWPHRLVVAVESPALDVDDVAGQPICAVTGDAGELWLEGQYPGAPGAPVTSDVVTADSDDACRSALDDGTVAAFVTARLSDAELDVRDDLRVIGGPPHEPRAAVVAGAAGTPGAPDLLAEIDRALDQMRADGTLARLSGSRFGGDLSTP